MSDYFSNYANLTQGGNDLKHSAARSLKGLTWRKNLFAIKASGETSDWLQVGHVCSSDSSKEVRIPVTAQQEKQKIRKQH